jgi:vacuolar-type H+-ATPase subunit F/Vma7
MNYQAENITNVATHALDKYGKAAAGFLYDHLCGEKAIITIKEDLKKKNLHILYVGKRSQRDFLLPLIEKIEKHPTIKNISITTIGHTESEGFFKGLENNEDSKIALVTASDSSNSLTIEIFPKKSSDIRDFSFAEPLGVQNEDIDDYTFKNSATKYDIIFCSWEFHFDLNWRLAHTHLFAFLKDGGSFVFAETTGDSLLFDGNFKEGETPENKSLHNFMKAFDKARIEDFYWNPEISSSDHFQMRKQTEFYFKKVITDKNFELVYDKVKLSKTTLIEEHIKKQQFSYLKIGLTKEKIEDFLEEEKEKNEKSLEYGLKDEIPFSKKISYWIAKDFMESELNSVNSRHWRYDDLIKNLQGLNDTKPYTLSRKALDTLVSHDIFFPNHTVSCSFFYWLNDDTKYWDYPVHLVNNHIGGTAKREEKDMFKQFLELMTFESLSDETGVFRYLIRDIKNKMQISFQFFNDDGDLKHLVNKDYKKTNSSLLYFVDYDKKRKPTVLKLAFTRQLFVSVRGKIEAFVIKLKKAIEAVSPKSNSVDVLKIRDDVRNPKDLLGSVNRFSIKADLQNAFELFWEENKPELELDFNKIVEAFTINTHLISEISTIIGESNTNDDKEKKEVPFKRILLSIALYIWNTKDFELSFYPSAAVENDKGISRGLGGIVLSEKLFNTASTKQPLTPNQVSLFIARNNALSEASNQIFYKIGISEHVNHRYQTFAQQSAIATIISRNGSHGIGSHAIPSLVNNHRDLVQKNDMAELKHALRDDDIFYKYLQDRFEFITQMGNPSLPKWTLTTWFGKDLMKRFLMQKHLLDNLASSEGLKGFEFLKKSKRSKKKAREADYGDNVEFLYGEITKVKNKKNEDRWFISKSLSDKGKEFKREIKWKNKPSSDDGNYQGSDKIRVKGKLSVKKGKPYLKEAEIMAGQIITKVRLRQFQAYQDGRAIGYKTNTSELLAKAIHIIRYEDIDKLIEKIKAEEETKIYRYGIVSTNDGSEIYIQLGTNNALRLDFLHKSTDKTDLNVGRRLIFTGKLDKEKKCFHEVVIHEVLHSELIIHPKNDDKTFKKDIPVSIVGGIVGYQAFYSILENIIRNAAKHNWQLFEDSEKKSSNLIVNIELDDQLDENNFICKIWTNTTDVSKDKGMASEKSCGDGVYSKKSLVEQLQKKLENPIIDNDGRPIQEDIGISEIKICAAFLAGKDWTGDPSVLRDKNVLLKLKTDRKTEDNEGYIKTFVAWETKNGKLIPRLGYRFRLLKAKEFLFFSPKDKQEEIKKVMGENGPSKSLSLGDLPSDSNPKPTLNLDYECCVLIAPKDGDKAANGAIKDSFLGRILAYTKEKTKENDNNVDELRKQEAELKKLENKLLKESIKFPHRLIVVCDDTKDKGDKKGKINILKEEKTGMGNYLRQRIAFIDRGQFDKMLEKGQKELSFGIYHEWVHFVEGKGKTDDKNVKDAFKLNIAIGNEGDNSVSETDRMNIPTLPFSLRGSNLDKPLNADKNEEGQSKSITNIVNNYNLERQRLIKEYEKTKEAKTDISNQVKTETSVETEYLPKTIKFGRHATYDANMHFLESLSGGKISFSTFVNIPDDENERDKFFMQLMESAQNYVLVLDERIMEYAKEKIERYDRFENANILVPTYFKVNNSEIHKENEKAEISGDPQELNYPKDNPTLTIRFKQQVKKLKKPNGEGRISTVVIHQTLLEKIIDKKTDNSDSKDNLMRIDDFIRWLKMTMNIPSVIIISGRGKNNNTSNLAKFIPFSDISSLLMQYYPEKWMLNRIIAESLH